MYIRFNEDVRTISGTYKVLNIENFEVVGMCVPHIIHCSIMVDAAVEVLHVQSTTA